jgi:hypothetical protein
VAGRFPLYTDEDVRGPLIKALRKAGWDIVRAIDTFPQRTPDLLHFERAAALGRVLVTNDEGHEATADQWYRAERTFPGLIAWPQRVYDQMTYGEIVEAFEELAAKDNPFSPYPIIFIRPKA